MIISTLVLGSFLVYGLTQINYQCDWTGFGPCDVVTGSDENYRPEKTLWDWLRLLIIPTVLALGAVYFNRAKSRIAQERAQDARLQTYLKEMTELLLDKNLRKPDAGEEVRQVAQVQTLIALRRLDRERRTILMQFLRASQLVGTDEKSMIVDFRHIDLSNADLSATPLFRMSLRQTDLHETKLTEANLSGADLTRADLSGAKLTRADLSGADLSGAKLTRADLSGADLSGAKLHGADLSGAKLSRANLCGADLTRADLEEAKLWWADLSGAKLTKAKLHGADLWDADLTKAKLHGADLWGANLEEADLIRADLSRVDLIRADLCEADLSGADLTGALVTPEELANAASLTGTTMPDGSIHNERPARPPNGGAGRLGLL